MKLEDPSIETYRDLNSRFEKGFIDYWFNGSLTGDDGKEYFLTYAIFCEGDRDVARLDISMEPIWCFTRPSSKVIQKNEIPEVDTLFIKPRGTAETEVSSTAFSIKLGGFDIRCSPPVYKLKYSGKECGLDLTLKIKGSPFWFNRGKEEGARITPSTLIWGFELFGDMEGTLTIGGKETHVIGVGIHECVTSSIQAWFEYGWMDWIWFHFDELYGLIFDMHGGKYKDGCIYLMKEKEYLVINDFDIDHPQWAYSPVLQHHWPIRISAKAKTDRGILFIEGDVLRSQTWRQQNKHRHAMNLPASDMEVRWTGNFVYNNGKKISLTNGRGGDEIIEVTNFAQ